MWEGGAPRFAVGMEAAVGRVDAGAPFGLGWTGSHIPVLPSVVGAPLSEAQLPSHDVPVVAPVQGGL